MRITFLFLFLLFCFVFQYQIKASPILKEKYLIYKFVRSIKNYDRYRLRDDDGDFEFVLGYKYLHDNKYFGGGTIKNYLPDDDHLYHNNNYYSLKTPDDYYDQSHGIDIQTNFSLFNIVFSYLSPRLNEKINRDTNDSDKQIVAGGYSVDFIIPCLKGRGREPGEIGIILNYSRHAVTGKTITTFDKWDNEYMPIHYHARFQSYDLMIYLAGIFYDSHYFSMKGGYGGVKTDLKFIPVFDTSDSASMLSLSGSSPSLFLGMGYGYIIKDTIVFRTSCDFATGMGSNSTVRFLLGIDVIFKHFTLTCELYSDRIEGEVYTKGESSTLLTYGTNSLLVLARFAY